jgi:hypothetical protein
MLQHFRHRPASETPFLAGLAIGAAMGLLGMGLLYATLDGPCTPRLAAADRAALAALADCASGEAERRIRDRHLREVPRPVPAVRPQRQPQTVSLHP